MMITREQVYKISLAAVTEAQRRIFDIAPKHQAQICAVHVGTIINEAIDAELSTAELPVQGEAVSVEKSITLRMLKTWCHANRENIHIDHGGVASVGRGAGKRLWDEHLLAMFPTLNRRRVSDTATTTLKPSVNELVEKDAERLRFLSEAERTVAGGKFVIQVIGTNNDYHMAYFAIPPSGGVPEPLHPDRLTALRAAIDAAIASHQSAKEQV
jgi:hypothetical protein